MWRERERERETERERERDRDRDRFVRGILQELLPTYLGKYNRSGLVLQHTLGND